MRAVVVGGGLAGITAALRLADAGADVTLLEARPRLGGAAFSFRRGDLTVDNGQHVFLRCCVAYRDLLVRLGATGSTHLQDRLDIPVVAGPLQDQVPAGTTARLRRSPHLPAPAHLGAALARYRVLRPAARARAVRGVLALRGLDPADPTLDATTFGAFLRRHGQDDATLSALFDVVGTATLNLPADEASLALAARVFRTGLLDRADAADLGYATVPLGHIHDDTAAAALAAAGVEVRRATKVAAVDRDGTVRVREGGTMPADRVVLALPPGAARGVAGWLPDTLDRLGSAAIVNVHVLYDRRVTGLEVAAAVGSPVQWVFDRTSSSGLAAGAGPAAARHGQYLAVTVSAAAREIDEPTEPLRARHVEALAALFPAARRARVVEAFVTRERRATFRQAPGSAALRPGPGGRDDRVLLAGSWTATGWPDTMEGAVRSGHAAADAALGRPRDPDAAGSFGTMGPPAGAHRPGGAVPGRGRPADRRDEEVESV